MANETSCIGCKFLYAHDRGYSNWTVEDTEIICALALNPALPASEPYDWKQEDDNWNATKNGRCSRYATGPRVRLDVDEEDTVESQTDDAEQRAAIKKHSGRKS